FFPKRRPYRSGLFEKRWTVEVASYRVRGHGQRTESHAAASSTGQPSQPKGAMSHQANAPRARRKQAWRIIQSRTASKRLANQAIIVASASDRAIVVRVTEISAAAGAHDRFTSSAEPGATRFSAIARSSSTAAPWGDTSSVLS